MVQLYIDIPGVGNVPVTYDVTDGNLAGFVGLQFTQIFTIFLKGNTLDSTDLTTFQAALDGLVDVTTGSEQGGQTYYLTYGMASYVATLLNSLIAAGENPAALDLAGLQTWAANGMTTQALGSIYSILVAGSNAPSTNHSIQAMIELEYVRLGNTMISNQLTGLKEALGVTNEALKVLAQVQDLKNQIVADTVNSTALDALNAFISNPGPAYTSIASYTAKYKELADAVFNTPLGTSLNDSVSAGGDPPSVTTNIVTQFTDLFVKLDQLSSKLQAPPYNQSLSDPNSLAAQLSALASSMSDVDTTTNPTPAQYVAAWILDAGTTSNGLPIPNGYLDEPIQTLINTAITGAENLNDQQKEQVQNSLYVFQEFYNSASSILGAMNTVITNIARGIAG